MDVETISKLACAVTPAQAGVQKSAKTLLDSGFRRNDDQRRSGYFEIGSCWFIKISRFARNDRIAMPFKNRSPSRSGP
jgi:hypothetical protein